MCLVVLNCLFLWHCRSGNVHHKLHETAPLASCEWAKLAQSIFLLTDIDRSRYFSFQNDTYQRLYHRNFHPDQSTIRSCSTSFIFAPFCPAFWGRAASPQGRSFIFHCTVLWCRSAQDQLSQELDIMFHLFWYYDVVSDSVHKARPLC